MILATSINGSGHNHQSSSRAKQSKNCKPFIEIVLHQMMMPTPPEDWILFPNEVVFCKHSTIRDGRTRNARGSLHTQNSATLSLDRSTPTYTKTTTKTKATDSGPSKPQITLTKSNGDDSAAKDSARSSPGDKRLERLATPDLSDVEEEGFWSCCGTSEDSV